MKNHTSNYTLGLDIGIGSVGWGIVDENQTIVDAGVRLFPEADKKNNEGRREYRSSRRLLRRRRHRLDRIHGLLREYNIISKAISPTSLNPYQIRVKGLSGSLTKDEFAVALLHIGKRRGIHNVDMDEDDATGTNELSTKDQIAKNNKLLKEKYVCELQLERLEELGELRGHTNRFKTSDYAKEAAQLLTTQKKFHPEIDEAFIEQYMELIEKRRTYYEGPGEPSPFGWEQDINQWYEQMMGKCSYYPDELRAVKESYSAQLFNVLNDLNNLTITREEAHKLTEEEKEMLVEDVFKTTINVSLKKIAKFLNVVEHDIKGYRVDKNHKPIFTSLKIYHDLRKITDKRELLEDISSLDEIAKIVTMYQSVPDKYAVLKQLNLPISEKEIQAIADLNYSATHALSLKMIHQLLPDLWATSHNQMELITQKKIRPKKYNYANKKYIPTEQINDFILSPVVKRAFTQSIRVINALIKKYGYPNEIVIELARESNSEDKKQFLKKLQKENESLNREIKKKLDAKDITNTKGLFNKLKLWHLQDGICMYSLKPIPIETLMDASGLFEIDHIIPRSVSFDDSFNNKVLVFKEENQKKSNKTPFQYLVSGKGQISYDKFKTHMLQMAKDKKKLTKKKLSYLLEERDINKFNVQKEFINRNLVDTRYATREIMTTLRTFFVENNQHVKIKSINGSFTHYLRKLWEMNKDRGADFKHHAEDALLVALANHIFETKAAFSVQSKLLEDGKAVDLETGEVLQEDAFRSAFAEKTKIAKSIKNYSNYKYSHRVDMKPNRQLMNDTVYSTRTKDGNEYVTSKIKDIYDNDQVKVKKLVQEKPESLLMFEHDPQTFEKLKSIVNQYSEAKNPLAKFLEEEGQYLTKYSKKGDGPVVKTIKYLDKKLGEHKDISHKYKPKGKKVVNLSLKPFRMDVFFENDTYKFVTVRYNDLKEEKNEYTICKTNYNEKLKSLDINNISAFLFSLYKNDVLELNGEEYRIIGHDDKRKKVELNTVPYNYKEFAKTKYNKENARVFKVIGKGTDTFKKINVNVLGQYYFNNIETLKFNYPK